MSNDISTLLGKTTGIAGSISDYNSIKNGSYGKLMKSYYNGNAANKTTGTGKSGRGGKNTTLDKILSESKTPILSKEAIEANANLGTAIKGLTSSLSALQSKNTYKNGKDNNPAANAKKSLKEFVSSYNDAVTSSKKSTKANISKNVKGIMDAVKENKTALKELGINANKDGTLTIDEKKLEQADTDKIRDLFDGDKAMSLGSKAASRLNRASYYVNEENAATAKDEAAKEATTKNSGSLVDSISRVKEDDLYATTRDEEGIDRYDVDAITEAASDFVNYYNSTLNSARNVTTTGLSANLSSMIQKTAQYSGELSEIGITVGTDGKLSMNKSAFANADMEEVRNTFDQYASAIESDARLLNYYSTTGTGTATGYSAEGGYLSAADMVAGMYDSLQ